MDPVTPLFPTPFMHIKRLVDREMLVDMAKELENQTWFRNVHTDLLTHTEIVNPASNKMFLKLRKLVMPKVVDFGSVMFGERLKWSVKEVWVNVLHHGGHQATHSHANSFVSGVIYLTQSHQSSNIVFHRNGGGGIDFVFANSHENMEINPYNAAKWQSDDIDAGDLVLFPSYLLHGVPTNEGDKRVSIAFNAIPDQINSWGYKIKFSK